MPRSAQGQGGAFRGLTFKEFMVGDGAKEVDQEAATSRELLLTTAASSDMRPPRRRGIMEKLTDSDMQAIRRNCAFLQAVLPEHNLLDSGEFSSLSTFLEAPYMHEKAKEMSQELAARKKEAKKSGVARDFGEKISAELVDRMGTKVSEAHAQLAWRSRIRMLRRRKTSKSMTSA